MSQNSPSDLCKSFSKAPDRLQIPCRECPVYGSSIFCGLKETSLDQILHDKITRRYGKKQVIHHQGIPSFGIYCIRSGLVKVFKTTQLDKQYIVRLAGPGHVLGLPTLFTEIPFLWTAEVVETATVCLLPRETLLPIVLENSQMALKMLKILSNFVEESEQERVELAQGLVRKRLARLLVHLSQRHGTHHPNGIQVNVPLSRGEMAEMIGAAPETMIRVLKEFREEGLLKVKGTEILILKPDDLNQLA